MRLADAVGLTAPAVARRHALALVYLFARFDHIQPYNLQKNAYVERFNWTVHYGLLSQNR
ncbi:hypothetical protein [Rhodoferax sp.]|uniref:hypothetical protein n=1 Tax=Rhodoferax sp. TaxID=50421 RepID=UPI00260AEABD|nr:hypothetical protein [Rhodoferax sp.]